MADLLIHQSPEILTSAPSRSARPLFLLAVFCCLGVAIISRLSFLGEPFKNDSGIYIYWGKVVWNGGWPYRDFWDTKLPGVPLMMGGLYGLLGSQWPAYVVLECLLGILAAFIGAVALSRYVSRNAFAPPLLFGLVAFNFSRLTITGFQLETVQIFFETASAALVLRSFSRRSSFSAFLAGLLGAMAAMPKPMGLGVVLAAGCACIYREDHRRATRSLAGLILGASLPIAGVIAWTLASPWRSELPSVLREISLYGEGTPWKSLLQLKTGIFFLLPVAPILIRYFFLACARRSENPNAASAPDPTVPIRTRIFLFVWMTAEIIGVILQRRLYGYHFLVLMPPAMMIFSVWPADTKSRLSPVLAAIAPLAILSLVFSVPGYQSWFHTHGDTTAVSRYIVTHTVPGDAVWADPSARLLLETGRASASNLAMTFYFVNHDDAPREFSDKLLADFDRTKPRYIVLDVIWDQQTRMLAAETPGLKWRPNRRTAYEQARQRVHAYVLKNFKLETTIDGEQIYRREP